MYQNVSHIGWTMASTVAEEHLSASLLAWTTCLLLISWNDASLIAYACAFHIHLSSKHCSDLQRMPHGEKSLLRSELYHSLSTLDDPTKMSLRFHLHNIKDTVFRSNQMLTQAFLLDPDVPRCDTQTEDNRENMWTFIMTIMKQLTPQKQLLYSRLAFVVFHLNEAYGIWITWS